MKRGLSPISPRRRLPLARLMSPPAIFWLLKGNDLVIVGGILNRPAFYLVANATIGGIADLKGKRVGINQPRRMAGMVMLVPIKKMGAWILS